MTIVIDTVTAPGFKGVIDAATVQRLVNATGLPQPQVMLDLTKVAALYALPPISQFYVGAIACGLTGNLYFGANMEYMGEPLSFCSHGEQGATINAWISGETGLSSVAVNAAPCGYCRQYLYETVSAKTLRIILATNTQGYEEMLLTDLLPLAFGPQDLGIQGGLLQPQSNGLSLIGASTPVTAAALKAANMCYAPYTKAYSGVGLLMRDGNTIAGPLSENAAYNPSLSPMEAALFAMNVAGYSYSDIVEAALCEVENPKVSQLQVSAEVLGSVSTVQVTPAPAR